MKNILKKATALKSLVLRRLRHTALLTAVLFPTGATEADTFTSNGSKLDYELLGSGDPVFLLHGGLASKRDLMVLAKHLSKTYRVVALDSREHGKSTNSDRQISYALMASDVVNLALHLGMEKITLVGQSDGGITALTVAQTKPEMVAQLVVIGSGYSHTVFSEETKHYLTSVKWPKEMDQSQFPGMYQPDYLAGGRDMSDYQSWYNEMARMWTSSPNFTVEQLRQIDVPTLLVNGDHNDMPLEHILTFYQALPNAQLYIVPGADHFLHHSHPEQLASAVTQFLAKR